MISLSFTSLDFLKYFVGTPETAKAVENNRNGTVNPEKPFFTDIALHGGKNVTGALVSEPRDVSIQITITSWDGKAVYEDTFQDGFKDIRFENTEPSGLYHLKITNLGNKPIIFHSNIYDQEMLGILNQQQSIKYLEKNYLPFVVISSFLVLGRYLGIGLLVIGGVIFVLERRKNRNTPS
jgi:hypothetical protein